MITTVIFEEQLFFFGALDAFEEYKKDTCTRFWNVMKLINSFIIHKIINNMQITEITHNLQPYFLLKEERHVTSNICMTISVSLPILIFSFLK